MLWDLNDAGMQSFRSPAAQAGWCEHIVPRLARQEAVIGDKAAPMRFSAEGRNVIFDYWEGRAAQSGDNGIISKQFAGIIAREGLPISGCYDQSLSAGRRRH